VDVDRRDGRCGDGELGASSDPKEKPFLLRYDSSCFLVDVRPVLDTSVLCRRLRVDASTLDEREDSREAVGGVRPRERGEHPLSPPDPRVFCGVLREGARLEPGDEGCEGVSAGVGAVDDETSCELCIRPLPIR